LKKSSAGDVCLKYITDALTVCFMAHIALMENPLKAAGDSGEESTLLSTENCREIK
jgi:hypothetical protein